MISMTMRMVAWLVLATIATAGVAIPVRAQTATIGRQANAEILLANMRRALATILVAYKAPETAKSNAGALVLTGTKDAAVEVDRLASALASRQPRAMSEATRKTAEAMGRLDGIFRMAGSTDPRAVEGMRALSANWATYTARYALARPAQSRAKVSAVQVAELQRNVARLRGEVQQLRANVRDNDAVARDLDALYVRIDRLEQRRVTEATYHSALVALSAINGIFVGYEVVAHVYYPDVYVILHDRRDQFAYYQGYWDGYYDGYYESWPATYYEAPFAAPGATVVNVDVTIHQQVETYTTQNINVFVQETEATETAFEVAPTPRDIGARPAVAAIEPELNATDLVETVQPDASALRAFEAGLATPTQEAKPAAERAGPPTSAGRDDNDDDASPAARLSAAPPTGPAGHEARQRDDGDADDAPPPPAREPILANPKPAPGDDSDDGVAGLAERTSRPRTASEPREHESVSDAAEPPAKAAPAESRVERDDEANAAPSRRSAPEPSAHNEED